MKRTLIIFFCFFLAPYLSFAQLNIGLTSGLYKHGLGTQGEERYVFSGIKVNVELFRDITFVTGIDYYFPSVRHTTVVGDRIPVPAPPPPPGVLIISFDDEGIDVPIDVKIKRLEVPMAFGFNLFQDKKTNISLLAGTSLAFYNNTYAYKFDTAKYYTEQVSDGQSDNHSRFSWLFGSEVTYDIAQNWRASFQARINASSFDVDKVPLLPSSYQASLGLMYKIGSRPEIIKNEYRDPKPNIYTGISVGFSKEPIGLGEYKEGIAGVGFTYYRRNYKLISLLPSVGFNTLFYSDESIYNKSALGLRAGLAANIQPINFLHIRSSFELGKIFGDIKQPYNTFFGLYLGGGVTYGKFETTLELGNVNYQQLLYERSRSFGPNLRLTTGYLLDMPPIKPQFESKYKYFPALKPFVTATDNAAGFGVQYYYRSYSRLSAVPALSINYLGARVNYAGMLGVNLQYLNALHFRVNSHIMSDMTDLDWGLSLSSGFALWRLEPSVDVGFFNRDSVFIRFGIGYLFNKAKTLLPRGWPG